MGAAGRKLLAPMLAISLATACKQPQEYVGQVQVNLRSGSPVGLVIDSSPRWEYDPTTQTLLINPNFPVNDQLESIMEQTSTNPLSSPVIIQMRPSHVVEAYADLTVRNVRYFTSEELAGYQSRDTAQR